MEPPSFNTHSCIADIANRVVQELHNDKDLKDLISFTNDEDDQESTQEDEFEFPHIFTDSSLQTDNINYNRQITPRYPLFDRSLLLNLDTNLSNHNDSKPASASASASAPAPAKNIVSTVTLTSTPVTASAPATHTVSTVTLTSTPVTASAPTLAPATDTVSIVTPTSTSVTASAPTIVLTTSTVRPATNIDPASPPSTRLSLSKLFSEDSDSTRSPNDFNTNSPAETYCIWKPQEQEHHQPPKQHHSRGKHKKSNSISISEDTSSPKRWRVRDLLKRSYSDDSKHTSSSSSSSVVFYSPPPKQKTGKDGSVVVFLPPISPKPINEKVKKPEKALKTTASMGGGCANHKPEDKTPAYKAKIGNIRLPAFLPYRQNQHQVDAFANHTNGPIKHMYR